MTQPKIGLTSRDLTVLQALSRYHLTGRMVFELSQTFGNPFTSVENARARLSLLYRHKFLKRGTRFVEGRSKNESYYFLTLKAASLFEELRHFNKKNSMFRPKGISMQAHSFLLAEIMVKMEQDIHLLKDICQRNGFIRENHFTVKGDKTGTIRPDGTIFLNVNGKNYLLFLEVDMSTEVVKSEKQRARSFERKIKIYSDFKSSFWEDETIHSLPGITGYRVITVCLSVERVQNLSDLAKSLNKSGMFWFTTAKAFLDKNRNCLFDRIWMLPKREFYPLF